MIIAIDEGHGCYPDIGADGVNGVLEDNLVKHVGDLLIKAINMTGNKAVNVRPISASNVNDSLQQRCKKAKSEGAELYVSIHFNVSDGKGHGTEVWCNPQNAVGLEYAQNVVKEIAKLGYTNRGIKDGYSGEHLFVIRNTSMPAILIEGCFIDNKWDLGRFDAIKMASAILKGLKLQNINQTVVPTIKPQTTNATKSVLSLKKGDSGEGVKILQTRLNKLGFNCGKIDGVFGNATELAVKKFQAARKLKQDGIVGPITFAKL